MARLYYGKRASVAQLRAWRLEGKSYSDIAGLLEISPGGVHKRLKTLGLTDLMGCLHKGTRPRNVARNEAIRKRYWAGDTLPMLSERFSLTRARISQIVR